MTERNRSDLQKKIEQALKRAGEDSNLRHAIAFHLEILRDSKPEEEIETQMEVCRYLFSKMFIDKLEFYPLQPFECELDENSDWPLSPLPSEVFGTEKQEEDERKIWFYNCLKIADVLDCRVSNALPNSYQLRVIHKYGVSRVLDDLQLLAIMHCTKTEFELLEKKKLLVCELVRVAVSKIDKVGGKIEIHVTVNKDSIQTFKPLPRLGRITEHDVPAYIFEPADTEKLSSYSDYLNSKPQFQNPHYYNELIEKCGIDPLTVYSYFPEYNRKRCIEGQTGQAILKESKLEDAKRLANSSLKNLEQKQYDESMKLIEEALKLCPSDDSLLAKLYDIRSDIYSEQSKPCISQNALCDLERAFRLSPEDDNIKRKFLRIQFKVANAHLRSKRFKEALPGFEMVVKYDKSNHLALRGLDYIKIKHADKLLNLEGKTLIDLQEQKIELLSELNNS